MSIRNTPLHVLLPLIAGTAFCGWAAAAPVDVNTADAAALAEALKGVGAKTAAEIVSHRKAHGPFRNPDDLLEVKGIGKKTLDLNRADILIGDGKAKGAVPVNKSRR